MGACYCVQSPPLARFTRHRNHAAYDATTATVGPFARPRGHPMTWFRMECGAADDRLFDELAEALQVSTSEAFYHYFAFTGRLAAEDTRGNMGDLLDRTIEKWAKWAGTPGGFAGVFRGLCQDSLTGELRGFRKRNQKLLEKQAKDRAKKKKTPGKAPAIQAEGETPAGLSGEPPPDPHVNGNGNRTTPTDSARAGDFAFEAGMATWPAPERRLWEALDTAENRRAVFAVLDTAPRVNTGNRAAWVGRLLGFLQGLDLPPGDCPFPDELATACRDYAGDFAPIHFRAFVSRVVRARGKPVGRGSGHVAQTRETLESWRAPV